MSALGQIISAMRMMKERAVVGAVTFGTAWVMVRAAEAADEHGVVEGDLAQRSEVVLAVVAAAAVAVALGRYLGLRRTGISAVLGVVLVGGVASLLRQRDYFIPWLGPIVAMTCCVTSAVLVASPAGRSHPPASR
jgi:hypothetical protein